MHKEINVSQNSKGRVVPFLRSVAEAYASNFDDLSEICFVFPNKRAGVFFLKHLRDAVGNRTVMAPYITSISDFVSELSALEISSKIDLLFRLYNIYVRIQKKEKGKLEDFDSFRNRGEILLNDFSEIDQYNVDADAILSNVIDYREIASNFLTEEQKKIMERYFGYVPELAEVEGFWKKMEPESDLKNRFIYLWQQMLPLYHGLNDSLAKEGLTTTGGAYRRALERLREEGRSAVKWKKVVMVGFNALSTTEALIFEELKKMESFSGMKGAFAEFFWDGTGPVLTSGNNDAATFLKYNRKNFPSPEWASEVMKQSEKEGLPAELRVIASPSNSAQGKIAGEIVREAVKKSGASEIREARVAVVLPDENLLMPLLYALPQELETVNLTMGYPLRNTSVISFINQLRALRATERLVNGGVAYYHHNLRLFLSHPYMHALLGSSVISKINGYVSGHHLITVPLKELAEISPEITWILRLLPSGSKTQDIIEYIEDILIRVSGALENKNGGVLKSRIDRAHIEIYRDALHRLGDAAEHHGIEMGIQGVFTMVDKLLGSEQVSFEGEPLEGLQVMGLLETRALDFERLIIMSMNDKVMPRKGSGRTFIPDSLRHGYGMPWANYREDLFSYYFYRLISRADKVTLIYDARAGEGMRSGGVSRYLMQLKYLYAPGIIKYENHKYLLNPHLRTAHAVEKTELVMTQLEAYTKLSSAKNLSASALKNYFVCPSKFYYENVCGIRVDDTVSEYIDAITQGLVLHQVMFYLYFPEKQRNKYLEKSILMTPEALRNIAEDRERIRTLIREAINKLHNKLGRDSLDRPLDGASELVAKQIEEQVLDIISYDITLAPFRLVGGEISRLVELSVPGTDKKVNIKYAIDRLDIIRDENGKDIYRIVDYKTGSADVSADDMESIFNGSKEAKNLFQLMFYANLMNMDLGLDNDIRLSIYEVSSIKKYGEIIPTFKVEEEGKKRKNTISILGHKTINQEFMNRTMEIIQEIFNPEVSFTVADNEESCKYCKLGSLCGRK